MGEKIFIKNQYGLESTRGTEVDATGRLMGTITMPTDRKPKYPKESLGVRAESMRSVIYQILADPIKYVHDDAVYQELPALLGITVKGGVTGAEQTGGEGDYLWAFDPSLTGDNDPDTLSLETGDDTQAYTIEYVMGRSIKFSGRLGSDEGVKIESDMFGKQVTPKAFTAAVSLPSVEPIKANNTQLYIDSTWAGLGSTQKTGLLREWSFEIISGNHPKFHGDSLMMTGHGEGYFMVLGTFVFEGNSNADTEFDAFQAQTEKAIRIAVPGSQIGTGENHLLQIDVFGTYEEVVPMGQTADDNNLHTAIFHAYYDDTGAELFDIDVITDISSV